MSQHSLYRMLMCAAITLTIPTISHSTVTHLAPPPQEYYTNKQYKVLMPYPYIGGEGDMGTRMEKAGQNIGWLSKCFYFPPYSSIYDFVFFSFPPYPVKATPTNPMMVMQMTKEFDPDFVIKLIGYSNLSNEHPHFLTLTRDINVIIETQGDNLLTYAGFLSVPQNLDPLIKFLESKGKKFYGIDWYPTTLDTPFESIKRDRLFYCGVLWDPRRSNPEYMTLYRYLDRSGYLDLYGPENVWPPELDSYKGHIPYDGVSLTNTMKKSGIALLLHSQEHLQSGVTTGRIFEAAAASCVIITDKHSFIIEEFGDSVLYIDIDKDKERSGLQMYKQINAHVKWIRSHPKEAEELARKAHAIFTQKFTLEKQLRDAAALHEQIKAENHTSMPIPNLF